MIFNMNNLILLSEVSVVIDARRKYYPKVRSQERKTTHKGNQDRKIKKQIYKRSYYLARKNGVLSKKDLVG